MLCIMHHNGSKVNKFNGIYSVWSKSGYDRSKSDGASQNVDAKRSILFGFNLDAVKRMQPATRQGSNSATVDDAITTIG